MIEARRSTLTVDPRRASHAGLWLDRYLPKQAEKSKKETLPDKLELFRAACTIATASLPTYKAFYARWHATLSDAAVRCSFKTATVSGRMIVGLGDESVTETSVALHHTYGVPYIPGSALKGLARRYARQRLDQAQWGPSSKAFQIVFGQMENAGYLTFFDALYVPGSAKRESPLEPDVITVHHRDYYGKGDKPPADWDSPNPVPFLSATGSYLVAIAGPAKWVNAAFTILGEALKELGIGAKTSSGYGRMVLQ